MNELKDFYNVELNDDELTIKLTEILTEKYSETIESISKTTYKPQRIELLIIKEAIEYAIRKIGEQR